MGPILTTPIKDKYTVTEIHNHMKMAASSMQGWRVNMEDAHISKFNIAQNVHIFGVFDGHGGQEVAKFAERHFVDELLNNKNFKEKNYSQALHEVFVRIDELIETSEGRKELSSYHSGNSDTVQEDEGLANNCGCTACVCLIADGKIYCANAGDARCVLFSKGQANAMSEDHKPDLDEEKNRIKNAGGYVINGRINGNLNVSRGFGDLEFKKNPNLEADKQMITAVPEIREHTITEDDEMIIIGCDGIWETMTNQQICEYVQEKFDVDKDLGQAVEAFLDKNLAPDTKSGLGCDNMTCICLLLK